MTQGVNALPLDTKPHHTIVVKIAPASQWHATGTTPTELIRIDGIDIPLSTVPSDLRRKYEHATLILGSTPATSPQRNLAKSHLNKVSRPARGVTAPAACSRRLPAAIDFSLFIKQQFSEARQ
jgi:hypothetical protein